MNDVLQMIKYVSTRPIFFIPYSVVIFLFCFIGIYHRYDLNLIIIIFSILASITGSKCANDFGNKNKWNKK